MCRSLCTPRGAHGPGARNNGLRALGAVWADLPARQLYLWPGASRDMQRLAKHEAALESSHWRRHRLKPLQASQQAV